jgi:four helix bundle protein
MACIAEGAGRWPPAEKRHFYGIARGSATECAAHLDALRNRGLVGAADYQECRKLLLSIVRILTKLSAPPQDP